MSYAMALDNSWDILSEDKMYDVNGGASFRRLGFTFWGKGIKFGRNFGHGFAWLV